MPKDSVPGKTELSLAEQLASILDQIGKDKENEEPNLQTCLIESEVKPRKDMAYNKNGNSLGKDIASEIRRRLALLDIAENQFRHLTILAPAHIFFPIIRLFVETGIIQVPHNKNNLFRTLRSVFRYLGYK